MKRMFEIATFTPEGTVKLPPAVARSLSPLDRFIVWQEGDMLHFKKISPSPLAVVAQAPEDTPLSLDEINEIVHEVRQQRQSHQNK